MTHPEHHYYVTATPDAGGPTVGRFWIMVGPFATHAEALDAVEPARTVATEHDPRAHWMLWGTSRIEGEPRAGRMNTLGLI